MNTKGIKRDHLSVIYANYLIISGAVTGSLKDLMMSYSDKVFFLLFFCKETLFMLEVSRKQSK